MTSRRDFLASTALSAIGLSSFARGSAYMDASRLAPARGFIDLLRSPDLVAVQTDAAERKLDRASEGRWAIEDIVITTTISISTSVKPFCGLLIAARSHFVI